MCGILGIARTNGDLNESSLERCLDLLGHRGPDAAGKNIMRGDFGAVGFGHTRLAILDLSDAGIQPMAFEDLMITYNGEIYNYREIREELLHSGYGFNSDTDTEVALKAFHCWGVEAFSRFRGMFAFSIFDRRRECLYLVRDRVGVKPLYFSMFDGGIAFSSEMRPLYGIPDISQQINREAMYTYFQYGYVPREMSILESCQKLLPGHYAVYDLKQSEIAYSEYWSVADYCQVNHDLGYNQAIDQLQDLMRESFRYRLVSDVPVGIFLSGGFDSACLASVLAESTTSLKAFTMGFDDPAYDETTTAAQVAQHLQLEHTIYKCTTTEARDLIPHLCEVYDEPFGDASALPTVLLSRLVSDEVKVALSADGGDELFAGYSRYQKMLNHWGSAQGYGRYIASVAPMISGLAGWLKFGKLRALAFRANKYAALAQSGSIDAAYLEYTKRFDDAELLRFITASGGAALLDRCRTADNISATAKLQLLDCQTYMVDDVLVKVDRASMSSGLEAREPFLDHKLIEFAMTLPDSMKLQDGIGKRIVRDIVYQHIPRAIIDQPKKGFGVPVLDWLKGDLREILTDTLSHQMLAEADLYDVKQVSNGLNRYLRGEKGNFEWVWFLFMFELWRQRWLR